ncbi:hypothetical protein NUW58_g1050 [Xylaria curta]|uniref:Uncharacterized protein n=1 Tax=Xylaria curta TaxID=42375 RepID=A0ACC1PNI9_9PEZI|nr:hypothetical protein NUW58_g1050 [Xylaria curta]
MSTPHTVAPEAVSREAAEFVSHKVDHRKRGIIKPVLTLTNRLPGRDQPDGYHCLVAELLPNTHTHTHTQREREREKQRLGSVKQAEERVRVRRERELCWPKNAYVVTVSIKASTTSVNDEGRSKNDIDTKICDLTLSYVTSKAVWAPIYDLTLSTTTESGALSFDARVTSQISETWDNCGITLSTSPTEFSRSGESVPTLVPRPIYASKPNNPQPAPYFPPGARVEGKYGCPPRQYDQPPGAGINYGGNVSGPAGYGGYESSNNQVAGEDGLSGASTQASAGASFVGNPALNIGDSSGVSSNPATLDVVCTAAKPSDKFTTGDPKLTEAQTFPDSESSSQSDEHVSLYDADCLAFPTGPELDLEFEESSFKETGLTSTYGLVGFKSLSPSSTSWLPRVARITYTSVVFRHVAVPKHKQTMFLQANQQPRPSEGAGRAHPPTAPSSDKPRYCAAPVACFPSLSASTPRCRCSIRSPKSSGK